MMPVTVGLDCRLTYSYPSCKYAVSGRHCILITADGWAEFPAAWRWLEIIAGLRLSHLSDGRSTKELLPKSEPYWFFKSVIPNSINALHFRGITSISKKFTDIERIEMMIKNLVKFVR